MKRDTIDDILSAAAANSADVIHTGPDLVVWGRLMSDSSLLRKQLTMLPREEDGYHGSLQVARSAAIRIFAHLEVLIRENNAAEEREAEAIAAAIDRADRVEGPVTVISDHKTSSNGARKPIEDCIDAQRLLKLRAIASIIHTSGGALTAPAILPRMRGPHPDVTAETLMDLLCFLEREEMAKPGAKSVTASGEVPKWTLTLRGLHELINVHGTTVAK